MQLDLLHAMPAERASSRTVTRVIFVMTCILFINFPDDLWVRMHERVYVPSKVIAISTPRSPFLSP